MKEIKEMTVEEMIETLDHFYVDDCLIKQYVDSSFVPTMIDRLRDEFNIFYHPRIKVEKTQFGTRYKVVPQHEELDQAYKNACENFKKELTQILGLCEYESNSMVIDKVKTNQKLIESYEDEINKLEDEINKLSKECFSLKKFSQNFTDQAYKNLEDKLAMVEKELHEAKTISINNRIDHNKFIKELTIALEMYRFSFNNDILKRCQGLVKDNNELIEENKNLKKLYKNSIEKQYRLETDNAELLRKVKIQDDSEKVISNLKKKQEETERLLHESVAKVNEECKVCMQYERKKIKNFMIDYLKRKRPVFYNTHTVELITNPLEDVFKMSVDT